LSAPDTNQAAANRARFAWVAAIVDDLRANLDADIKVACIRDAKTGEVLAGKPIPGTTFKAR
jgi:hypothetical protein